MGRNRTDHSQFPPSPSLCPHPHIQPSSWTRPLQESFNAIPPDEEHCPAEWFSELEVVRGQVAVEARPMPEGITLETILHCIVHNMHFTKTYQTAHPRRGSTEDLVVAEWSGADRGSRLLTTTVTIYIPFEARGRLISGQRFACGTLVDGRRVLALHYSTQTPDFMCCTTHRAEALTEFVESPQGGVVHATVYCHTKFSTWSFVDYIIRSRVFAEISENFGYYLDEVKGCIGPVRTETEQEQAPVQKLIDPPTLDRQNQTALSQGGEVCYGEKGVVQTVLEDDYNPDYQPTEQEVLESAQRLGIDSMQLARRDEKLKSALSKASSDSAAAVVTAAHLKTPTYGVVFTYENQRWYLGAGWMSSLLPADPFAWSSADGKVFLPANDTYDGAPRQWAGPWVLDCDPESSSIDAEAGWEYAFDFSAQFCSTSFRTSYVRRRCWRRRFEGYPPPPHDSTTISERD